MPLHEALDAHARRTGVPYLHPDEPTVQQDLLGSAPVIAWQEGKAAFLFAAEGCWSELPPLYARYGTGATGRLIARLKALEGAGAALVCDSGMQATALVFDALMVPGAHAVLCRQVYNKTTSYMRWLVDRLGGSLTIVDDGDHAALAAAIAPGTRVVFAETFTNPLVRAQDIPALVALVTAARAVAPGVRLVVDSTIATPWAFAAPLLSHGVDVVVGERHQGARRHRPRPVGLHRDQRHPHGQRRHGSHGHAWRHSRLAARCGDPRGLRRGRSGARAAFRTATRVAAFLAAHPKVSEVFHPSRPDHPDAAVIARGYRRHGSLLSFRVAGADEARTRHVADVIAMTTIIRYALSFDGLATKVNHHQTVSEYFTPPDQLRRSGFDRLIRLGVGLEDADDLMAALNWALHHAPGVAPGDVTAWQRARRAALGTTPR